MLYSCIHTATLGVKGLNAETRRLSDNVSVERWRTAVILWSYGRELGDRSSPLIVTTRRRAGAVEAWPATS